MEGATANDLPSMAAGTREEPRTGCTSCYRRSRRFPWRGLTSLALVALVGASSTSTALAFNDGGNRGSRVLRGAGDDGGPKSALEVEAHRGLAPAPLAGAVAAALPQTKAAAPAAPSAPLQPVAIHTLGNLYLSKTPAPLAISPDNKVRGGGDDPGPKFGGVTYPGQNFLLPLHLTPCFPSTASSSTYRIVANHLESSPVLW